MHDAVMDYCTESIQKEMIAGKKVIELGARNINGVVTTFVKDFSPSSYLGVDIIKDENVDLVIDAADLDKHFEPESFDFVFSTELMEHVLDWKKVVSNQKSLLKKGGYLLLTTRSKGFAYHGCPYDFWRYEIDDMERIFSDMEIVSLVKDKQMPGVFILARKPQEFVESDLSELRLYSIVKWARIGQISQKDVTPWDMRRNMLYFGTRVKLANAVPPSWKHFVKSLLYKTDRQYHEELIERESSKTHEQRPG